MSRKAFFSFHYVPDNWRAAQVRSMGVIEGDEPVTDNDWESVTKGGDKAIESWINSQMRGKSCCIVLIGSATANRKWINYEIATAWNSGQGVLGIYIHNLKDRKGNQSIQGLNPFDYITLGAATLTPIVPAYNPPFSDSIKSYAHIRANLESWVEKAIEIRSRYYDLFRTTLSSTRGAADPSHSGGA